MQDLSDGATTSGIKPNDSKEEDKSYGINIKDNPLCL